MTLKVKTLSYISNRLNEQMVRLGQVVKLAQAPTKANTVALIIHEIEHLIKLAKIICDEAIDQTNTILQAHKNTLLTYANGDFARGNAAMFLNPSQFHSTTFTRAQGNLDALNDLLIGIEQSKPQAAANDLQKTSAYITLVALRYALEQTQRHAEFSKRLSYAIVAINIVNQFTEGESLTENTELKTVQAAVVSKEAFQFKPMEKEIKKTDIDISIAELKKRIEQLKLDEMIEALSSVTNQTQKNVQQNKI